MPRTIDKVRATLPGGHSGAYHITPGLSQLLLTIIGVELAAFEVAVREADDEDAMAIWLRANADLSRYGYANDTLSQLRHENLPPEHRAHCASLYPEYLRSRYPLAFDLIEADDRELYPTLGKW
jgi:hypothetical protein